MIISFLLKSAICSAVFLLYYVLFLKNKRVYSFNRWYLLTSTVMSLVIPVLHIKIPSLHADTINAFPVLQVLGTRQVEAERFSEGGSQLNLTSLMIGLYLIVSLVMGIILIHKVTRVYMLRRKSEVIQLDNCLLIMTSLHAAPFSFMRMLFWRSDVPIDSEEGQRILAHEMTHIRQWHTIDKLYMQILLCICWVNPFYWIIRNDLWLQHEFIADSHAVCDGDMDGFARMLLMATDYKSFASVTNRFTQSSVKRRIYMLSGAASRHRGVRYLMMFPLVLTTLLFFSFSVEYDRSGIVQAKKPVVVVLDAGHGGNDNGAVGASGHAEKDLTLRISKKLAALAENYNIKVVSTRTEDLTLTLVDRIKESNSINADMFVSIHVNDYKISDTTNYYEVGVSKANVGYTESVVIGSAILNRLRSSGITTKITEKGALALKRNDHPALIIECGNMNDADNMQFLHDDARLEELCRSILSGIVDYSSRK